jgi:phospholipid transport system substrate-binding protein
MKIMQFKKIITLIVFFSSLNTLAYANFESEEKFVSDFATSAINILGDESLNNNDKNIQFTDLVMSSIDIDFISQLVLGKYWKLASDDQRANYLKAFKAYFISSYANRLDQYSGEEVVVISSNAAKKYVIVKTNIIRDGTETLKIELDWRLIKRDGRTKIVDLSIEGISLIIAERETFISYLNNNDGNLASLIKMMQSKTN